MAEHVSRISLERMPPCGLSRINVKLLWRRGLPLLKSETASGFAGQ
jgi:hypothetical protein